MQPPTQQTAEYHGNISAAPTSERVRVALGGGSGSAATDDLLRLLRRRLLIVCSILAGMTSAGLVLDVLMRVLSTRAEARIPLGEWLRYIAWIIVPLAVSATSAAVLWRRPPASERGLRTIELLVVGVVYAVLLWGGFNSHVWGQLQAVEGEPYRFKSAAWSAYGNMGALVWFFWLTTYGAFIPNTWRRCAIVIGCLGSSFLVLFALQGYWLRPLDAEKVMETLLYWSFWVGLAGVIAVFSTSRIEILQRRVAEARILGRYILREKLGSGGMGEVYRAEHVLLRRPCALKTIRPEKAGDPDTLHRFEREVQITATLSHPNTVQVFDYGHADDGTFYYVMEYLPGLTLEELVRRHGPLTPSRAVHFLRHVCASLGEAHARGLIHRDIKPGNVMVCERGGVSDVAKVLDFGLVRVPKDDADGGTLTRQGTVAGTPAFMSPEQAGGESVIDPRSDIYSVGALAYFLLTGKPPFADRSAARMLAAHLYEPPGALPAAMPTDLTAVVMRCLAKAPSERWPNAASLEAALASTRVVAWSALDAATWWESVAGCTHESPAAVATATWAEHIKA